MRHKKPNPGTKICLISKIDGLLLDRVTEVIPDNLCYINRALVRSNDWFEAARRTFRTFRARGQTSEWFRTEPIRIRSVWSISTHQSVSRKLFVCNEFECKICVWLPQIECSPIDIYFDFVHENVYACLYRKLLDDYLFSYWWHLNTFQCILYININWKTGVLTWVSCDGSHHAHSHYQSSELEV